MRSLMSQVKILILKSSFRNKACLYIAHLPFSFCQQTGSKLNYRSSLLPYRLINRFSPLFYIWELWTRFCFYFCLCFVSQYLPGEYSELATTRPTVINVLIFHPALYWLTLFPTVSRWGTILISRIRKLCLFFLKNRSREKTIFILKKTFLFSKRRKEWNECL